MNNLEIYEKMKNTPAEAKKKIEAGRLKGFTDINPMFRIKMLTEVFGPCGKGWYFAPCKRELVEGADGNIKAFVAINLFVKYEDEWSAPIYGEGGSSFVSEERSGKYTDDEAYKKALTDAIGSACKLLGMSADIYWNKDRTKYTSFTEAVATGSTTKGNKDTPLNEKDRLTELCKQLAKKEGKTVKEICEILQQKSGKQMNDETTAYFISYCEKLLK